MSPETSIARRQVELIDACGFHLRFAAEFIRLSQQFQSRVWVLHEGRRYDGKSVLDLMTMAAGCGSRLQLEALGSDAEAAVEALAVLIGVRPAESPDGRQSGSDSDGGREFS
jgi:phosphotransferase system HPr (HPr) family protein